MSPQSFSPPCASPGTNEVEYFGMSTCHPYNFYEVPVLLL